MLFVMINLNKKKFFCESMNNFSAALKNILGFPRTRKFPICILENDIKYIK